LNIKEKKLENSRYEIEVEIPKDRVEVEYKMVFDKFIKSAKIDGFRKGKAPLSIVENRYGEAADHEVADNIVRHEFWNVVTEKKLTPITEPKFEFEKAARGSGFNFKAIFEIPPSIEIGKYKDIHVEEQSCEITENDIQDEIDSIREKHAETIVKDKDAIAKKGDMVRIRLRRLDIEQDEFKEYAIILGKSKDESALDDGVIGMKVDDEKEITVSYKSDYYIKDIAGKKIKYLVQLFEINDMKLPDFDDEFAKKNNYESKDDMQKKLKEYIERYVSEKTRGDAKAKIIEEIIKNTKFEIPESLIVTEMYSLFKRTQQRIGYNNDNFTEFAEMMGIDPETLRTKLHEDASQSIKTTLVLSEIVKTENLKVDEIKYKEVVEGIAKKNNKTIEEIEEMINKDNKKPNIESELMLEQAMEFIYTSAKIKKLKPVKLLELINTK
jgi:trigger factor